MTAYIYKQLWLTYLSTSELVRSLETARTRVIINNQQRDREGEYLWTGIANDILQELGARQLKLPVEQPPEEGAAD